VAGLSKNQKNQMNPIRFNFIKQNISGDLSDKTVLEVGSRIVSGSIRGYFETLNPKEYVGVDIVAGEGVDQILNIHELASHFGENVFDIIVCSDTLEHIEDYQSASLNMHTVLKSIKLIGSSQRILEALT